MDNTIQERWVATGIWCLKSPAHFGGGEGLHSDMIVLRDHAGNPFIPGTSIAGALRNLMALNLLYEDEYKQSAKPDDNHSFGKEKNYMQLLFGGGNDHDTQSWLIVDDAFLLTENDEDTRFLDILERRDGVALDPITRTARDKAKYDFEVLPPGMRFSLRFELVIWTPPDHHKEKKVLFKNENISEVKKAFRTLLDLCENNSLRMGAKTSRGFGRVQASEIALYQIDCTPLAEGISQSFLGWLEDGQQNPTRASSKPLQQFIKNKNELGNSYSRQLKQFKMTIQLQLLSSLIVRSYLAESFAPDSVNLTQYDCAKNHSFHTLPGTSIAGALRHRAEKILNTLAENSTPPSTFNAFNFINEMFGIVKEKKKSKEKDNILGSRLIVEETVFDAVNQVNEMIQNRIAIDRLTGGTIDGALFDEMPVWSGKNPLSAKLEIRLIWPKKEEVGLFLLLLKDIWTGWLTFGGEASVGRGVFLGTQARIEWKNFEIEGNKTNLNWNFQSETSWPFVNSDLPLQIQNGDKNELESYVNNLNEVLTKS